MNIQVTARHQPVSDTLQDWARAKVDHLSHFFDRIHRVEVILDTDKKKRHEAEVVVHAARGTVLVCHTSEPTAEAALDAALEKMERQLRKFKERLRGHGGPVRRKRVPDAVLGSSARRTR